MNAPKRIMIGISSAALLLGAGTGIAAASLTDTPTTPSPIIQGCGGPPGGAAIAAYLGLTSDQVQIDLKDGQTLAQIATAQGKTVSGLEDAIVADAKTHLDAAVAAGDLTAEQETANLADLQSHIADMVNSTGPPAGGPGMRGGHGGPGDGPDSQAVATYLGLSADQVQTDLSDGQTLAQIATAQGKTASGLEDAIVADAKTRLDAAVSAGTLTAAQETAMLADLQAHVADMVNSTGPPAGTKGGPGGVPAYGRRLAPPRR
jgi:hypothetical protein